MSTYIVRKATLEDLETCVIMSMDFMKETPYSNNELDYNSLKYVFIKSLNDGLAFVAEDNGDVFGMLIAHKAPAFFNNNVLIAQEIGWWIDYEYRNSKISGELIRAFEQEAVKDCKYTVMSLLSTSPEQMKEYFKHIGYSAKECSYFKENF